MNFPQRPLLMIAPVAAVALAFYLVWPKATRTPRAPSASMPAAPGPATQHPTATPFSIDSDLPLRDQRLLLLQFDRKETIDWILRELEVGTDYATGMDLSVGSDQNLTSWPSYRVFLIDVLFQIDPLLAAERSRELIASSDSPDEWAISLRNVAKADRDGSATEWLREKTTALISSERWKEDPSAGYLNAFDLVVHTRHTELAPDLLKLADDPERRALRHAAFLAIDRLVQSSPEAMLPILARTSNRYARSGPMLSNLMARADVREEAQRSALESYLLDERRSEEDLTSFAQVFPNANFHVSNNLLTRTEGIDGVSLADRDRAALEVVRAWLEDERFARAHPALRVAEARLRRFVEGEAEN